MQLARGHPDVLAEMRFNAAGQSQDDRFPLKTRCQLADQGVEFQRAEINFHSQALQILTDNGGDVDTLGTARAGAKAEFHAVAPRVFNNAVPISVHKTGSFKDRPGLIQVIIIFNDIRVIEETSAWTH